MSASVKIAFDLSLAGQGTFLTLGDPVKGVLGSSTYVLAGDVLQDVTADVRSVSVKRGKPRNSKAFDAGSGQIVLDNRARLFDPTAGTAVSPYSPSIKPRKAITVESAGVPIFTGIVDDWDLSWDLGGDATATVKATDGFAILSRDTIGSATMTPQASGARVSAILDTLGWSGGARNIDPGVSTLMADVISGSPTGLAYLQTVEASEQGALFMNRAGQVQFRERTDLQAVRSDVAFGGSGIPYTAIDVQYGTEYLFTEVTVTRSNAGTVTSRSTAGIADYGEIAQSVATVLADDDQAQYLADFLVGRYSTPTLRIDGVRVALTALAPEQQALVLSLELGDAVQVTFAPAVGPAIVRTVAVIGIAHEVVPAFHTVSLDFADTIGSFILGSSTFGVLGEDLLGF